MVVRGPGDVKAGYCGLATSWDGTAGSKVTLWAATRAASVVPVQVLINPTASALTAASGVSVAPGTYKVVFTPVSQSTRTLSGPLPTVPSGLYPNAGWLNADGVPKQLAFGFVGSTGSVTDAHEVSDVRVSTFNAVPQLAVSATSYAAATPVAGAPVSYAIIPRLLSGVDETVPISMSQTAPAGVTPVGAYGTEWVCAAPVVRTITCTTSGSAFSGGTTLPAITVVGVVTTSGVTAAIVQASSTTRVWSADANPAVLTTMTAGVVPPAPTGVTLSPAIGPIAGGTTVTSAGNLNGPPTAVLVGTAAELQAGTPVVLLPCADAETSGCFTVVGDTS